MPTIDDVLNKLSNTKYLTKLDLRKAFYQIPLTKDSWQYTAFVTEFGQFEFTVVPFGMKFYTSICSRIINNLLTGYNEFVTSFVDDLIIYSESFNDHIKYVDLILSKLKSCGITLNQSKCSFASTTVKFLGFEVDQGKIKPTDDKIDAIRTFPRSTTKKEFRSFLGLLNYYRKFVPNLATEIALLTEMLKAISPDKLI